MKYSNKIAISSNYDLNVNLFGNNLLDRTRRNHASFVKAHVPYQHQALDLTYRLITNLKGIYYAGLSGIILFEISLINKIYLITVHQHILNS